MISKQANVMFQAHQVRVRVRVCVYFLHLLQTYAKRQSSGNPLLVSEKKSSETFYS